VGTKLRLRDGESNLLAGLLSEKERTSLKGVPGTLHIPILSRLFASNDNQVSQTDIVMLLTPHIVRTHELTEKDFMPIYIGSQQNLGLSGPPPIMGQTTEPETVPQASAPPAPQAGSLAPGSAVPGPPGTATKAVIPPGSSPIPGTIGVPVQPAAVPPAQPPAAPPEQLPQAGAPPIPPAAPPALAKPISPPATPAGQAGAVPLAPAAKADAQTQVLVGAPTTPMLVAGGPYTVPIAISGVSRVSTVSLSITFNPRVLRVRLPQEGDFMRKGGAKVIFTHKTDEAAGRLDMILTRVNDTVGASGDGVVVGIIFDAIGAGTSALTAAGVATAPGGATVPLQFVPATVTVR
jgi:general secretion pathway protein D